MEKCPQSNHHGCEPHDEQVPPTGTRKSFKCASTDPYVQDDRPQITNERGDKARFGVVMLKHYYLTIPASGHTSVHRDDVELRDLQNVSTFQ